MRIKKTQLTFFLSANYCTGVFDDEAKSTVFTCTSDMGFILVRF